MKYWSSSESSKDILGSLLDVSRDADVGIAKALLQSPKELYDWEFCYIPICMSDEFSEFYPQRSSVSTDERRIFHSPKLSHDVFRTGSRNERHNEYVMGLISGLGLLLEAGLGHEDKLKLEADLKSLMR